MITDVHAHIYLSDMEENKRNLLRTAQRYSVTRYYISNVEGVHYPDEETVTLCNESVRDFCREQPDLIRGYTYLNPRNKNTLEELRRGIEDYAMAGVKLWVATHCDVPEVFPIAEQLIAYDKPLLLHTFWKSVGQLPDETTADHVANLAKRYPELKIIMAHLGGEAYHSLRAIAGCPNVWVDNSGTLVGSNDIDYAVKLLGTDRILFGSDMGIAFAGPYGQILEADLTEEEREKLLWKNAAKLFGEGY